MIYKNSTRFIGFSFFINRVSKIISCLFYNKKASLLYKEATPLLIPLLRENYFVL